MTEPGTTRKWKRWVLGVGLLTVAVPIVAMLVLSSGAADEYIRKTIVEQIQKLPSGSAELAAFHLNPWRLRVTLRDLTICGPEPAGTPPVFHVHRPAAGSGA